VLTAEVDAYLAGIPSALAPDLTEVVGLIAPHAGLVYSGPVAAHAYALLRGRSYEAAILVGPSHYESFDGVAVVPSGAFDTPIGAVRIDGDLAETLMRQTPLVKARASAHDREHALELQLPFLARVQPGVPIVPLVMGDQSPRTVHVLARALADVGLGRRLLLVASSDLSHFHDARTAAGLDGVVTAALAGFDGPALERALARNPDHACGGGPMAAVMRASWARGARDARLLCYRDSSAVSGDTHTVVGYAAAAFGTAAVPATCPDSEGPPRCHAH